jgi:hypothetical protein
MNHKPLAPIECQILRQYFYLRETTKADDTFEIRQQILLDGLHHYFDGNLFLLDNDTFEDLIRDECFLNISETEFKMKLETTELIVGTDNEVLLNSLSNFQSLSKKTVCLEEFKKELGEIVDESMLDDKMELHIILINMKLKSQRRKRIIWDSGNPYLYKIS